MAVECRILGRRIQFRVPVEITLAIKETLTLEPKSGDSEKD